MFSRQNFDTNTSFSELKQRIAQNIRTYGIEKIDPIFAENQVSNVDVFAFQALVFPVPVEEQQKKNLKVDVSVVDDVMKIMMKSGFSSFTRSRPHQFYKVDFNLNHFERSMTYEEKIEAIVRYEAMEMGVVKINISVSSIKEEIGQTIITKLGKGKGWFTTWFSPPSPREPMTQAHCVFARKRGMEGVELNDDRQIQIAKKSKRAPTSPIVAKVPEAPIAPVNANSQITVNVPVVAQAPESSTAQVPPNALVATTAPSATNTRKLDYGELDIYRKF